MPLTICVDSLATPQFVPLQLVAQECADTFESRFITVAVESTEVPIAYAAATGTIIKDYHCPDNVPSFSPNQTAALRIEITLLLELCTVVNLVLDSLHTRDNTNKLRAKLRFVLETKTLSSVRSYAWEFTSL